MDRDINRKVHMEEQQIDDEIENDGENGVAQNSNANNGNDSIILDESDEDLADADYSSFYRSDSPLELVEENQNNDRLPLIPTDFTSISEAMQNFTVVFESRYGAQHPPFYEGSLQNAITDAFEAPGRGNEERRPLALYLHNDDTVGAHIFAQTVLCSSEVSNLLKCQFILWAWDMTQQQNRQSFYEWMGVSNLSSISESLRLIPHSKYPLLIILVKERGAISRSTIIYGQDNISATIQKIMTGLDQYQLIKQQDREEERSRMEREQFRREQVEEYERSLAADQAKQQEIKKQQQIKHEEILKKQQDEKEKRQRLNTLAQILPTEPSADDPEAVVIRLRYPNGELKVRRFRRDECLEMLVIYAETLGFDQVKYRLWTCDRPKKEVGNLDVSKTFGQLCWKREQITVEEI